MDEVLKLRWRDGRLHQPEHWSSSSVKTGLSSSVNYSKPRQGDGSFQMVWISRCNPLDQMENSESPKDLSTTADNEPMDLMKDSAKDLLYPATPTMGISLSYGSDGFRRYKRFVHTSYTQMMGISLLLWIR